MTLKDNIDLSRLPQHVAIIMDGNGRWAKKQNRERTFGHENGVDSVRNVTEAAAELGIGYLTLYAFSTENWNRPQEEINILMSLLVGAIENETPTLMKNNVKLEFIGEIEKLSEETIATINKVTEQTKNNTGLTLIIALSYSSRWEITQAMRNIAKKIENKEITSEQINESIISNNLCTKDYPDPDLLIRTSGEYRLSNYLLWQLAYAELYFTDVLWPDFSKDNFCDALIDFQSRERRFGKISEQVVK